MENLMVSIIKEATSYCPMGHLVDPSQVPQYWWAVCMSLVSSCSIGGTLLNLQLHFMSFLETLIYCVGPVGADVMMSSWEANMNTIKIDYHHLAVVIYLTPTMTSAIFSCHNHHTLKQRPYLIVKSRWWMYTCHIHVGIIMIWWPRTHRPGSSHLVKLHVHVHCFLPWRPRSKTL